MWGVDAQIRAALGRAVSWGNIADDYAGAATKFARGGYSDIVNRLFALDRPWGELKPSLTKPPPKYGTTPVFPQLPSVADAEAFRQALQTALDDFFATYFSAADAYMAAVRWVLDALTTNDPKLPGVAFDAIWAKARQHVVAQGNDVSDLSLPTSVSYTFDALSAFDDAEAYVWSKVKTELWTHAASLKVRDIRLEAILATGEYIKALAKIDATVLSGQGALLEAKQRAQTSATAWYSALLMPKAVDSEREGIRKSELRGFDMSDAAHLFTALTQKVESHIGAAENMGKVAQGAQAALNNVVSASQVKF